MSAGALAFSHVTRRFGSHTAVDDLSLDVNPGELLALVGASGSGKTTTLRIAAGYESVDSGTVSLNGKDITTLPPQRRDFGMVFQHYALFPHMSVEDNVGFGLEARGVAKRARRTRAQDALAAVGLAGAGGRAVQSLSGGEQQRVALARAVVIEPRVLLLDEPLSNLDPTLRQSMRDELRAMLRRLQVTALFVTHDQEDAFAVADRVAVLRLGRLLQVASPEELYARPASLEVGRFIGRSTIVEAEDRGAHAVIRIRDVERTVPVVRPADDGRPIQAARLVLRPEQLAFAPEDAEDAWTGTVMGRRFTGATLLYRVSLNDGLIAEVVSTDAGIREGDRVGVRIARGPVAMVPG